MKNLDQAKYHTVRADIKLSALQASQGRISESDYDRYVSEIRENLETALLHIQELEIEHLMESLDDES